MLILASQSSVRKSLLQAAGLAFETHTAQLDERAVESSALANGADGAVVAEILATAKARSVAAMTPGAVVIGADQTLALGDELLHKPASRLAALHQLDRLKGRTHRLHAGVALVRDDTLLWSQVETAELTMRDFSDAERDTVLALEGDAILASVGGYRLEGPSIRLFETIKGDYFSILGLPLLPLLSALRRYAPQLFEGRPEP